jgi:hypothetical protein
MLYARHKRLEARAEADAATALQEALAALPPQPP